MDGQADQAPITEDDLAGVFLADTSQETGSEEEDQATDDSPEVTDQDESGNEDESPDDGSEDDESDDSDAPPNPTSGRKFKVTVKGEDGADLQEEVDEKELVNGYLRHRDYTRKTQDLSQKETQAVEMVRGEVQKARTFYQEQARLAMAAVQELAGLRTPQEMMVLAQTDPGAYVAEQARQQQIQAVMQNIQHGMQQQARQAQQQTEAEQQQEFHKAWGVLGQAGIDKPKLKGIFEGVAKNYGVDEARFANVTDPKVVLIMRDALAYRELQAKKPEVTNKAKNAPRLPQRQNITHASASKKKLQDALKSGRGGVDALAAVFASK